MPHARPRTSVAIVQRSLRRYRQGFYDYLRHDLAGDGIDLLLYHSTPPPEQDARDDPLDVPWARYLPRRDIRLAGARVVWQPLDAGLRGSALVIVEQADRLLLNYRLLWRQRRGHGRMAFWGHGRTFSDERGASGEWVKRRSAREAHWWFAYTERSAEAARAAGVDPGRITVVNNAIDTSQLAQDIRRARSDGVEHLRDRFGVGEGPVGLFLGTLREEKRLDVLFDAADRIHAQRDDFHLVVVGAGALEADVRARAEGRPWVRYLGSQYGDARAEVLALADVLLLPGWVGLTILDSFVSGTPLVTSSDSPHPPEIAYLRDGENGRSVVDGGDPDRYAAAVLDLLADPAQLQRLVRGCEADAERYGIEDMARRFADGIRHALAVDPLAVVPRNVVRRVRPSRLKRRSG